MTKDQDQTYTALLMDAASLTIKVMRGEIDALKEHTKVLEHSHALLYASRQVEGPL